MSQAMKDAMIKDLEVSLKVLEKYPEEKYWIYPGHDWINHLLSERFMSKEEIYDWTIDNEPKIKYKDFYPVIEEAVRTLKSMSPDNPWIEDTYNSMSWCCVLNFVNQVGYDEFGY